jgi:hypothetical protein
MRLAFGPGSAVLILGPATGIKVLVVMVVSCEMAGAQRTCRISFELAFTLRQPSVELAFRPAFEEFQFLRGFSPGSWSRRFRTPDHANVG